MFVPPAVKQAFSLIYMRLLSVTTFASRLFVQILSLAPAYVRYCEYSRLHLGMTQQ